MYGIVLGFAYFLDASFPSPHLASFMLHGLLIVFMLCYVVYSRVLCSVVITHVCVLCFSYTVNKVTSLHLHPA